MGWIIEEDGGRTHVQTLRGGAMISKTWYTQREWDRVVGWGKVPQEYAKLESKDDEQKNRSVDENTDD